MTVPWCCCEELFLSKFRSHPFKWKMQTHPMKVMLFLHGALAWNTGEKVWNIKLEFVRFGLGRDCIELSSSPVPKSTWLHFRKVQPWNCAFCDCNWTCCLVDTTNICYSLILRNFSACWSDQGFWVIHSLLAVLANSGPGIKQNVNGLFPGGGSF